MFCTGCGVAYAVPEYNEAIAAASCTTASAIASCLDACGTANERVGAVLIVSPTYFGEVCDVQGKKPKLNGAIHTMLHLLSVALLLSYAGD